MDVGYSIQTKFLELSEDGAPATPAGLRPPGPETLMVFCWRSNLTQPGTGLIHHFEADSEAYPAGAISSRPDPLA